MKNLFISEKYYTDIMDNLSDGVYVLNTDGYFIYVNNVILNRSGISRDQFYRLHFLDIVDPEFREQVKRNFQRVMKGEAGIPYELRYKSSNGQTITVEVHSKPIYEGEKIVGLQGISRDITSRKRLEEELLLSEKKYLDIFEYVPVGLYRASPEGRYLDANPYTARMLGYDSPEELIQTITDVGTQVYLHPKDRHEVLRLLKEQGYIQNFEAEFIQKNGNTVWGSLSAKVVRDVKGNILYHEGICQDITERRQAEEALRKSEEKYRAVMENASDPILLADDQGNLIEANRMAKSFFGYPSKELLQMHYTQLHPTMERERTIAAFEDNLTRGKGGLQKGIVLRKDGTTVPVDITATAVEYDGRRVLQASFRDISEHKRTKDSLEIMVWERTVELSEKNKQLVDENKERKLAETALRRKTKELHLHSGKLQEMNAALKVLLKQREEDKTELEEKVMANVNELLLPYLEKLKTSRLDAKGKVHVSIIEANLKGIISPFTHRLSSKYSGFTPREIQVANLIKQGKSTKDIAEFIGISRSAINIYRNQIRHKLGIITKKINLRTHLMSLS